MVAEPEHERNSAQLYDLGQGELDGCGMALPDERRRPVLQGIGGDAVGQWLVVSDQWLVRPSRARRGETGGHDCLQHDILLLVAKHAILIPSYPQKRV